MKFLSSSLLNYKQRLRRLRFIAILLLVFISIPLGTILYFGYQKLKDDYLAKYIHTAKKIEQIIDLKLTDRRTKSDILRVDAFNYYWQEYNPFTKKSHQAISPLANLDNKNEWLVGYFQYNKQGQFNSPVWPYSQVSNNTTSSSNKPIEQALTPDLILRKNTANQVQQLLLASSSIQQTVKKLNQQEFTDEDKLFNVFFDMPEHFIFYRVVKIAEQYLLQGYIVKRKEYLAYLVKDILERFRFDSSIQVEVKAIAGGSQAEYLFYENLANNESQVIFLPQVNRQFQQQAIYHCILYKPFDTYTLTFTTNYLPMTPAMIYSCIFVTMLVLFILAACYGFYRLGVKQITLAEQRLNFVSSVSHELKTPLTSICMYSQMLKEGTVLSETHRQKYVGYICDESERLTRLINNILQLSVLN